MESLIVFDTATALEDRWVRHLCALYAAVVIAVAVVVRL
jgi:hypothetical protein